MSMPLVRTGPGNEVPACTTPDRLMAFLQSRNPRVDHRYDNLAEIYAAEGRRLKIRWDYAFFHMLLETGDLSFMRSPTEPGPVAPSQNNFADIGAAGPGIPGESFPDIVSGVRAHLEHLIVYAGATISAPVAKRTKDVQNWGVLKPWLKELGRKVTFSDLALRWAMGQESYVKALARLASEFYASYCTENRGTVVATLVRPPRLASAWSATSDPRAPSPAPAARPQRDWSIIAKPKPSRLGRPAQPRDGANAGKPAVATSPIPAISPVRRPARKRIAALEPPHQPSQQARPATTAGARTPPRVTKPAQPEKPERHKLAKLVSGNKVYLTTSMGATIPIRFLSNGKIIGHANGYAFFLGSQTDRGKWWIENDMLCTRWKVWLDRDKHCIKIVGRKGGLFHWRSATGKTGTARIVGS